MDYIDKSHYVIVPLISTQNLSLKVSQYPLILCFMAPIVMLNPTQPMEFP